MVLNEWMKSGCLPMQNSRLWPRIEKIFGTPQNFWTHKGKRKRRLNGKRKRRGKGQPCWPIHCFFSGPNWAMARGNGEEEGWGREWTALWAEGPRHISLCCCLLLPFRWAWPPFRPPDNSISLFWVKEGNPNGPKRKMSRWEMSKAKGIKWLLGWTNYQKWGDVNWMRMDGFNVRTNWRKLDQQQWGLKLMAKLGGNLGGGANVSSIFHGK